VSREGLRLNATRPTKLDPLALASGQESYASGVGIPTIDDGRAPGQILKGQAVEAKKNEENVTRASRISEEMRVDGPGLVARQPDCPASSNPGRERRRGSRGNWPWSWISSPGPPAGPTDVVVAGGRSSAAAGNQN
jgi:hypothetical protein